MDLVRVESRGLYCEPGDFFIDPWRPVDRALITHGHSDHARAGHRWVAAAASGEEILRHRLGDDLPLESKFYGEKFKLGETWVSFHPAGHILGSAQVRIEHKGRVWVVSGDYKRTFDPSCEPFEVVECDTFISEATFAIPIYRWEPGIETARKIYEWWTSEPERPTLLFCYSLGKTQRVMQELRNFTDRTVYLHGAAMATSQAYQNQGRLDLPFKAVSDMPKDFSFKGELIIAPPSAHRSPWMKRFKDPQTAFASGWMQVRGARRRRGYERGFVLSDHADWKELNDTIRDVKAKTVFLTHGNTDVLAKYLREQGKEVRLFTTEYGDEGEGT